MSGFLAMLSENIMKFDSEYVIETINLSRNLDVNTSKHGNKFFAVSSLKEPPLRGKRLFENKEWITLFTGDMVDHLEVPHREIIDLLENRKFNNFNRFKGIFAVLAFDKNNKKLYLVSDRRAQQPIYCFFSDDGSLYISTEMATFCRLKKNLEFNEEWLWQYMFFNYPIASTTFLKNVERMPPASVFEYDIELYKHKIIKYAGIYKKKEKLLKGKHSFNLAKEIFRRRIPNYFRGVNSIACALSGGWDARTVLALAPELDKIIAYTYGVPGCYDLNGAKQTAERTHIKHIEIYFDNNFVKDLPTYALNTIFLSSGLEKVTRASLLYVYKKLYKEYNCGLFISGISGDHIFRGHAHVPNMISNDMALIFHRGNVQINDNFWSKMFGDKFTEFKRVIIHQLDFLKKFFNTHDFSLPECQLLYLLYEVAPKSFGGEVSIAKNFGTIRIPYWDNDIIELAFSIEESALTFSKFIGNKINIKKENELYSYVLSQLSPLFAKVPVGNTKPIIVLKCDLIYQLYRIYKAILKRGIKILHLKSFHSIPLEDNEYWLNDIHKKFIDNLIFSRNSLLRKYITIKYIKELKSDRNIHWIGKLTNIEIILRLIKNNWERFW